MTADKVGSRCGTVTGAFHHSKRGEKPCDACAEAKRQYDKRRLGAPELKVRARLRARAQMRAYNRLAHAHADEYRRLYEQAKKEIDAEEVLDPSGAS